VLSGLEALAAHPGNAAKAFGHAEIVLRLGMNAPILRSWSCPARERDVDTVAAECAGLTYVTDAIPGITRQRRRDGWRYRRPDGTEIIDPAERAWIDAIGIPPAWTQVWISPTPNGHILATGRDRRGRKQYRYHPRWQEVRDRTKYHRMGEFGQALPACAGTSTGTSSRACPGKGARRGGPTDG
jgi:DNA topoisomerase IB